MAYQIGAFAPHAPLAVQEIHDLITPATVAVGLMADPEKFERFDDPVRCSVVYPFAAMSFGPATPLS